MINIGKEEYSNVRKMVIFKYFSHCGSFPQDFEQVSVSFTLRLQDIIRVVFLRVWVVFFYLYDLKMHSVVLKRN